MKKIDATVKKETRYIAIVGVFLSILLQSVFLIVGKWDYTVLLGNLYGLLVAVGNFLLLGVTVQNTLGKEPDEVKKSINASQSLRLLAMFVLAAVGYLIFRSDIYAFIALIIPYFFPRIAIALLPLLKKINFQKR